MFHNTLITNALTYHYSLVLRVRELFFLLKIANEIIYFTYALHNNVDQ